MTDYIFSNGVVASKSNELLSREEINKIIASATINEALERLFENSYYAKFSSLNQYTQIIKSAKQEILDFIKQEAPNDQVKNFFLYQIDFNNIILLIKARLVGEEKIIDLVENFGFFEKQTLYSAIYKKKYALLKNKNLIAMLEEFDNLGSYDNPCEIDFFLKSKKYDFLEQFTKRDYLNNILQTMRDIENLSIIFRSDKLSSFPKILKCGTLQKGQLESIFKGDLSVFNDIKNKHLSDILYSFFEKNTERNMQKFEKLKVEFLCKRIKLLSQDIETPYPFIYFILRKQIELINLQMIFSLKNSSLGDKIDARLLEV